MKRIKCLLGMHSYSQASTRVVDEKYGYLICRVCNCCVYCGKVREDIIPIPFPKWLCRKSEEDE